MNWNRAELKTRAKGDLSGNYWYAFLVSVVIMITGGSHHWGGGGAGGSSAGGTGGHGGLGGDEFSLWLALLILVGMTLVILFRVFIGFAVEVGGRRFFLRLPGGDNDLGQLGYGFHSDRYRDIWVTMLRRGVYLILWTLLLIIPGIVKMYAYRLVPYILADNPHIGNKRAIELSNQMTMGEKLEIFILDLSFIGWYLLGALAFGIGVLFVQPYYDATNAELYFELRQQALDRGLTTAEELRL